MDRHPRDSQPDDERSGHYSADELDLPEITEQRVESILCSATLVLSCVVALALPVIVLLDWLRR